MIGTAALSVPFLPLITAAAISAAGGIACVLLASLMPLGRVNRLTPHAVLAEE